VQDPTPQENSVEHQLGVLLQKLMFKMRKFVLMRTCPEIVSKNNLETRIALVLHGSNRGKTDNIQQFFSELSSN